VPVNICCNHIRDDHPSVICLFNTWWLLRLDPCGIPCTGKLDVWVKYWVGEVIYESADISSKGDVSHSGGPCPERWQVMNLASGVLVVRKAADKTTEGRRWLLYERKI
jgi:hypothetical protein